MFRSPSLHRRPTQGCWPSKYSGRTAEQAQEQANCWWRGELVQPPRKTEWRFFKTFKTELSMTPPLAIHMKVMKSLSHKYQKGRNKQMKLQGLRRRLTGRWPHSRNLLLAYCVERGGLCCRLFLSDPSLPTLCSYLSKVSPASSHRRPSGVLYDVPARMPTYTRAVSGGRCVILSPAKAKSITCTSYTRRPSA